MIKKIKLKDLVIWSDNPRYDIPETTDLCESTEYELMDLLWTQLKEKDMLSLAANINTNGFRESRLPIVVNEDGQYRVYDGNRRLTCAKFIALKDSRLPFDSFNFTQETEILVTVVDRSQALEEMDEIHSGTNGGRVIPWDAFTRDRSLAQRNKKPKYPKAYEFASKLDIQKRGDFGNTNYTDLQTILNNKKLSDELQKKTPNYSEQFEILKKLRKEIRKPWSRYLPLYNKDENVQIELTKLLNSIDRNDHDDTVKQNNDKKKTNPITSFSIHKNRYEMTARSTINLKNVIRTNLSKTELEKVSFDLNGSDFDMDTSSGLIAGTNRPGEYHLYVIYMNFRLPITIRLIPHAKKNVEKKSTIISEGFYTETYDLINENYEPIAYLIKYLSATEVTQENVYAMTILYRQFLEFTYKAYDSAKCLKTKINDSLPGGISAINNTIKSENKQLFSNADTRIINAQIISYIALVQKNAHNINSIASIDLINFQKILSEFLIYIIKELSN